MLKFMNGFVLGMIFTILTAAAAALGVYVGHEESPKTNPGPNPHMPRQRYGPTSN